MKTSSLLKHIVFALCLISTGVFGKIKNGYEPLLYHHTLSLQILRLRLLEQKSLPAAQRRRLKSELTAVTRYLALHQSTEEILHQLKIISPATYYESDTIKDRVGRPVDIYIKLVPSDKARTALSAASFLRPASYDSDLNTSEYGAHSASIEIWVGDNALFQLSHELGHVNFVIPNLTAYCIFYSRFYDTQKSKPSYIGHHPRDQSGKYAEVFQQRFLRDKKEYLRKGGRKPESPVALLTAATRSLKNPEEYQNNLAKRHRPVFQEHSRSVREGRNNGPFD